MRRGLKGLEDSPLCLPELGIPTLDGRHFSHGSRYPATPFPGGVAIPETRETRLSDLQSELLSSLTPSQVW